MYLLLQCGHTTATVLLLSDPSQSVTENYVVDRRDPLRNRARPIRPATASRLSPRSNCGKARKRENTQPPALVAGFSLPSLAIRAGFYPRSQTETVLFCTPLQIVSANRPRSIRTFNVCRSAQRRPPLRPLRLSCAAKTKQVGNVCSFEPNSFLAPFTISYEWNPRHSPLGENT
jgi:hypothetical protein